MPGLHSAALLTPRELAGLLKVSQSTLHVWRRSGTGPAWLRLRRIVRYTNADVNSWLNARDVRQAHRRTEARGNRE